MRLSRKISASCALRRFAASSNGRALLAERPSLLAALSDREVLARMPRASLGRAYLDYLDRNGFAPNGLLAQTTLLNITTDHRWMSSTCRSSG